VEEGSWIEIVNSSGEKLLGKLERYDDTQPFDENNLCIHWSSYRIHIQLDQIIRRYPKVVLHKQLKEINPSKRTKDESE
jgi:hypothetical protein